jgi:hypothetical protein
MVFSGGCYYGILNVLDPTIQYDENGKVISALRLATTEQPGDNDLSQRNDIQTDHRGYNEFREAQEIIVVETVESTQPPDVDRGSILDVPGVDDWDFDLRNVETFPEDGAVVAGYIATQPTELPIKMFGSLEEPVHDHEPPVVPPVIGSDGHSIQTESSDITTMAKAHASTETEAPKESGPDKAESGAVITLATGSELYAVGKRDVDAVDNSDNITEPSSEPFVEGHYLTPTRGVAASEATPLFRGITRKNWQGVLYYLRSGSFRFSPLSSPGKEDIAKQAQTWVTKKDNDGTELWRQLPLHTAVCFGAPLIVIEKLIQVYPKALRSPDCHDNLPLHLAFIFDAHDTVTALLMKAFPASIHELNRQGLQPIQCSNEVSSETFQSNAELFGALSDYTRAIAENDPDRLIEQLQDVRAQLKAVNDTLFSASPPRKIEAIKEYMLNPETRLQQVAVDDYSPAAFLREIVMATGICATAPVFDPLEKTDTQNVSVPASPQDQSDRQQSGSVAITSEPPASAPKHQKCRVMEYCQKTKSWKEV